MKEWIDVFFFSSPSGIVRYLYQMLIDCSFFSNTGIKDKHTVSQRDGFGQVVGNENRRLVCLTDDLRDINILIFYGRC